MANPSVQTQHQVCSGKQGHNFGRNKFVILLLLIEGQEQPFRWQLLVIRDLCAPGVFGIDFINHFSVGIQMNPSGKNYLTFGKCNNQIVPLVSPNAPNLPEMHEDNRFAGAHIFRQKEKPSQTAAALQEEVGKGANGLPPGRPPDATATGGAGNLMTGGGTPQS